MVYINLTAFFINLESSILRICPSHCILRALIQFTMLNVHVAADASSWGVLLVMMATILLLAPLRAFRTCSVRRHASEPYVNIEHTFDLYSLILRFRCSDPFRQMCRIFPNRCLARAIRIFTSAICPPSASKCEPKYLNLQQLLAGVSLAPPHFW